MNCPNCGAEMQSGIMYSDNYPYWTQQEKLPVIRHPKDMVTLRPVGDESTGNFSFPFHDYSDVLLCRSCKTVVFQYN